MATSAPPFSVFLFIPSFSVFSFPPIYQLHLFFSFSFFPHFAARQIMRVAHFCVAYFRALAHTHKFSHIVRTYQKLIYSHTLPGMWHVACGGCVCLCNEVKINEFLSTTTATTTTNSVTSWLVVSLSRLPWKLI